MFQMRAALLASAMAVVGPVGATTEMSPNYMDNLLELSADGLTVTRPSLSNTYRNVGCLDAKATGKWYFECTIDNVGTGTGMSVAIGNYLSPIEDNFIGFTGGAGACYPISGTVQNNTGNLPGDGAFVAGDVICMALDADAKTFTVRRNNGTWRGPYPLTGDGAVGAWFPMLVTYNQNQQATFNFGATEFLYGPLAGYSAWTVNEDIPTALYYRYQIDKVSSGFVGARELEFATSFGGVDESVSATASSATVGNEASKAIDNNTTTYWVSDSIPKQWIEVSVGSPKRIVEARYTVRSDTTNTYPDHFALAASPDGVTYYPIFRKEGESFTTGQMRTFRWDKRTVFLPTFGTVDGGTTFLDLSESKHTITAVNQARAETGVKPFTKSSLRLDGTDDYTTTPIHPEFSLACGDFTIEGFVRWFDTLENYAPFIGVWPSSPAADQQWELGLNLGQLRLRFKNAAGQQGTTDFAISPTVGPWYHYAVCRWGNKTYLCFDGSLLEIYSLPATFRSLYEGSTAPLLIGKTFVDSELNLSPPRITHGVALYRGDYTPPVADLALI